MKFSERMGIESATKSIQISSIDAHLRNALWSLLTIHYWDVIWFPINQRNVIRASDLRDLFSALWIDYFKIPTDTIPTAFKGGSKDGGLER